MPGPYDGAEVLLWVNMAEPAQASLTAGTANAAVTVTANAVGVIGNSIRLTISTPAGATTSVAVSYTGTNTDIVVSPATGATALQVRDAINAAAAAKYYVTASLPSGSTGASAIVAQAQTALSGGADASTTANFVPVARQQGIDFEDTMDTIDAVAKGDRFALALAGRQSGSFELSGLHSFEDTTQERVRRAYQRRELVLFRRIYPVSVAGGSAPVIHEANCRVTGFSISEPDSDVATFSAPVVLQENWRVV